MYDKIFTKKHNNLYVKPNLYSVYIIVIAIYIPYQNHILIILYVFCKGLS